VCLWDELENQVISQELVCFSLQKQESMSMAVLPLQFGTDDSYNCP
jgi:hypothetical protein